MLNNPLGLSRRNMFRVIDGKMVPCQVLDVDDPKEYIAGNRRPSTQTIEGGLYCCVHNPAGSTTFCRTCPFESSKPEVGIGGAPTRASILPDDAKERKKYPVSTGFLNYFPDAVIAVSNVSFLAGEQHHPGEPTHWDRSKSSDEDDALMRHFLCRGTVDSDGIRHSAKMAWRAMALLQKEIERG